MGGCLITRQALANVSPHGMCLLKNRGREDSENPYGAQIDLRTQVFGERTLI